MAYFNNKLNPKSAANIAELVATMVVLMMLSLFFINAIMNTVEVDPKTNRKVEPGKGETNLKAIDEFRDAARLRGMVNKKLEVPLPTNYPKEAGSAYYDEATQKGLPVPYDKAVSADKLVIRVYRVNTNENCAASNDSFVYVPDDSDSDHPFPHIALKVGNETKIIDTPTEEDARLTASNLMTTYPSVVKFLKSDTYQIDSLMKCQVDTTKRQLRSNGALATVPANNNIAANRDGDITLPLSTFIDPIADSKLYFSIQKPILKQQFRDQGIID